MTRLPTDRTLDDHFSKIFKFENKIKASGWTKAKMPDNSWNKKKTPSFQDFSL